MMNHAGLDEITEDNYDVMDGDKNGEKMTSFKIFQ